MQREQFKIGNTVTLALVAAGATAYVFCLFLPAGRTTARLQTELRDKREFITRIESQRAATDQTAVDLQATETYVQKWRERAPATSELSQWFGKMHLAVRKSGSTVARFEPADTTPLATLAKAPVSLAWSGNFAQIAQGLLELEQLPTTLWFDEVKLTAPREDTKKVLCEAKLVILAVGNEKSGESKRNDNR